MTHFAQRAAKGTQVSRYFSTGTRNDLGLLGGAGGRLPQHGQTSKLVTVLGNFSAKGDLCRRLPRRNVTAGCHGGVGRTRGVGCALGVGVGLGGGPDGTQDFPPGFKSLKLHYHPITAAWVVGAELALAFPLARSICRRCSSAAKRRLFRPRRPFHCRSRLPCAPLGHQAR
jgi:hypothetical protein